jgi:hypothetical protein
MTATRPRHHGKRAFCALLAITSAACAAGGPDPGWRLVVIPSFERPALHRNIPGSDTAILAVARPATFGLFEYATTRGALRWSRDLGQQYGDTWLDAADIEIRRDKTRVIERIFITGDNPLLSSLALTPAFYRRFEPLLGDGFHVIIPDRTTIALYPRLGRPIPAAEAASLFQTWLLASHPVSREIFRATPDGLLADGLLTEESDPQKIPLP